MVEKSRRNLPRKSEQDGPAPQPDGVPESLRQQLDEQLRDILNNKQVPIAVDRIVAILSQHTYNESKLPAARELVELENAVPGSAVRAIEMAEKEQDFIISETKKNNKRSFLIDLYGPALGICGLLILAALCAYMVYRGYPYAAVVAAVGAIGTVVGIFAYKSRPESEAPTKQSSSQKTRRR